MMASDLIDELEKLIDQHGDLPVTTGGQLKPVGDIRVFDIDGDVAGPPVEFALFEEE